MSKYMEVATAMFKAARTSKNFGRVAAVCRPISASEGRVQVEFEVTEELTNLLGGLHGGCTATLVDIVTTVACVTSKRALPGVSVNLHVDYFTPAKMGETVVMDAWVLKAGKKLAFTEADLYRKSDKVMIAKGLHTKAFPDV